MKIKTLQKYWIPLQAILGIALYLILHFLGSVYHNVPLGVVIVLGGLPLLWQTLTEMVKGKFNVDLIAIVSIFGGAVIGQYLPAAIIVLMMSGGEALEQIALSRASGALEALMKRSPRIANRWDGANYQEVAISEVKMSDQLLVKPGESVPVDAEIIKGESDVNEALLTGESVPVTRKVGEMVISGSINLTGPLTLVAKTTAGESTFAKIMELVRSAQGKKAGIEQLADRVGAWFTPITFLAVVLTWFFTRKVELAYAVLVIATPCPLILATPVAIIAGIGRAAKRGIIVKSGAALEGLARVRAVLFDKTGTLTKGELHLKDVHIIPHSVTRSEVLTWAASLEQNSNHVIAQSVVAAAHKDNCRIEEAQQVEEVPGGGMRGTVKNRLVLVGSAHFLGTEGIKIEDSEQGEVGIIQLFVAVDGIHVATLLLADALRPESKSVMKLLHTYGCEPILVTGDRAGVAKALADQLGISEVHAEVSPEGKLKVVEGVIARQHALGWTTAMVGDGINDAPALERADIGIALAKQGGEVAVESADIVLLNARIDHLPEAIRISKRMLEIASQGIWFGMGASGIGMIAASAGYLPPVTGALLQEVIDVLVLINALRVLKI